MACAKDLKARAWIPLECRECPEKDRKSLKASLASDHYAERAARFAKDLVAEVLEHVEQRHDAKLQNSLSVLFELYRQREWATDVVGPWAIAALLTCRPATEPECTSASETLYGFTGAGTDRAAVPQDVTFVGCGPRTEDVLFELAAFRRAVEAKRVSEQREMAGDRPAVMPRADRFEKIPWVVRSLFNGLREGTAHGIGGGLGVWAAKCLAEALTEAADGEVWVTVGGLVAAEMAVMSLNHLYMHRHVENHQVFGQAVGEHLREYAVSRYFKLISLGALVQPLVLPCIFGLAGYDVGRRYSTEQNATSLVLPGADVNQTCGNASVHAEDLSAYAAQWALLPAQVMAAGITARLIRQVIQSCTRSSLTSGLQIGYEIVGQEGKLKPMRLRDRDQLRVNALRDSLYVMTSVLTLCVGQSAANGMSSRIRQALCLATQAVGLEFTSAWGAINEGCDGFAPDLAIRLAVAYPRRFGLKPPRGTRVVCWNDRQKGFGDGVQVVWQDFIGNSMIRLKTAAVGNDGFGAAANAARLAGNLHLERLARFIGAVMNGSTGGRRGAMLSHLKNPAEVPDPGGLETLIARSLRRSKLQRKLTPREQSIVTSIESMSSLQDVFARSDTFEPGEDSKADDATHGGAVSSSEVEV